MVSVGESWMIHQLCQTFLPPINFPTIRYLKPGATTNLQALYHVYINIIYSVFDSQTVLNTNISSCMRSISGFDLIPVMKINTIVVHHIALAISSLR